MASQASSRARSYQASQAALAAQIIPLIARAYAQVDVHSLRESLPRFKTLVRAIVARYAKASSALAQAYYRSERANAGVGGRAPQQPPPQIPAEQVDKTVDWATRGLWGPDPDRKATLVDLDESLQKLVLDSGRQAAMNSAEQDQQAKGWVRIVEPGACSFCLMLATRGPVYKSRRTGGFESHDHCRCHVEPFFGGEWEPSAEVRHAQELWGNAGGDPVEFRRLVEGRSNG